MTGFVPPPPVTLEPKIMSNLLRNTNGSNEHSANDDRLAATDLRSVTAQKESSSPPTCTPAESAPPISVHPCSPVVENSASVPQSFDAESLKLNVGSSPSPGATLLNNLSSLIRRHVLLPEHASEVLALWVLHTYAFELL